MLVVDKEGVEGNAVVAPHSNEREDPVDLEGQGLAAEVEGLRGREDQGGQRTQSKGMKSYMMLVDQTVEYRTGVLDPKVQVVQVFQVLHVFYKDQMALTEQSARQHQRRNKVGIPGVVDHVDIGIRYPSGLDSV